MPRLIVYLSDEAFARLQAKAEAEYRDLRQQAALAIERELNRDLVPVKARAAEPEPAQAAQP